MATIAIGDIHGNLAALEEVLDQVTSGLGPDDTVVFLGDYIDRGPRSKECIDRILDLRSSSRAKVATLLGNHEDWLLQTMRDPTRHSWLLGMEGFETIASYSPEAAIEIRRAAGRAGAALITERVRLPYESFFSSLPASHVAFFECLVPYHRTSEAIHVHAGLDPRIRDLEKQPLDALVWGTDGFPDSYDGDETVVYGHWGDAVLDPQGWPTPRRRDRTVGIDTIAHGVLTAFRLPGGDVFQSRRHPGPAAADRPHR